MKQLVKTLRDIQSAGRWDIDFHLPPEGIKCFKKSLLKRVDEVADIGKDKRDPGKKPDEAFQYIDISSVDVSIGVITNPQDVLGEEAPSRARKVVRAFDLVVSTCRPTRGAIAVVPIELHNQIASTGFSIIRPKEGVNPFFLHYALRLSSTLEQFRKWSTGSSYPAILDDDVSKTLIPMPDTKIQDEIAGKIVEALRERERAIRAADRVWKSVLDSFTESLTESKSTPPKEQVPEGLSVEQMVRSTDEIRAILAELPPLNSERNGAEIQEELLES